MHVAQSHFHDIVPANELGIRSVWINRLGERAEPPPTRELPDLTGLADVLDELVPRAMPYQYRLMSSWDQRGWRTAFSGRELDHVGLDVKHGRAVDRVEAAHG